MIMIMFLVVIILITLPSIVWLYALADVAINAFRTLGTKIILLLLLCFFPPIGTLLYYLIGRGQRITRFPIGRFVVTCIIVLPIVMTIAYFLLSQEPEAFIDHLRQHY